MQPLWVIKGFNVVKEQRLGMLPITGNLVLKTFGFECRPEAFHGRIIVTIALPELYEYLNPMPFEAAAQIEKDLAEDLRVEGYTIAGGT